MSGLSLANAIGGGGGALTDSLQPAGNQRALDSFHDAMQRHEAQPATDPALADHAAAAAPRVEGVDHAAGAAGRDRVRRALDLDGATRPNPGDTILGGITKLRGAFDERQARINGIMKGSVVDTNALLAMQMEVAQYTILVDVSSKLTGKTTQSLDTLMKGQ